MIDLGKFIDLKRKLEKIFQIIISYSVFAWAFQNDRYALKLFYNLQYKFYVKKLFYI